MLGSPAGPGGTSQRGGLWPLAPAPAPAPTSFSAEGLGKYGVYSLFPGGPSLGSALYSHSTIGRFASGQFQQSAGNTFHAAHKVSDSLFSSGYSTFGAPTPPPGSPYSPIPVAQLELLAKGFSAANSNSLIIQQSPLQQLADYPIISKKIQEKTCDEKCCSVKTPKSCKCQPPSPIKSSKYQQDTITGCSRTNPIEWGSVNVKKEPGACQVAEISTSASPMIKLEVTSPTQKNCIDGAGGVYSNSLINSGGCNIPLGIAIARQKVHQEVLSSPTLPPTGLLTTVNGGAHIKEITKISEIDPSVATGSMAANTSMGGQGGGALLQCTEERAGGLSAWQVGGAHNNQALATPTLWQYPAPVPVEPMVPLPLPLPPVGFQLVRDPTTGGFLLLPTAAGIEPLQQAVVWPSYAQPPSVLLPSVPPLPPPPLQLLSSASSDYLSSSTTLHQHTQTHSTRLLAVTTDPKRKIPMPLPATTLIKIETDATLDQTKTLQTVAATAPAPTTTGTLFTDQNMAPLVTTHVIYQHPPNLMLSQTPSASPQAAAPRSSQSQLEVPTSRSQATSPVTCLTPPLDLHVQEEEESPSNVQDAGNQTDIPICGEDEPAAPYNFGEVGAEVKGKNEEIASRSSDDISNERSTETELLSEPADSPHRTFSEEEIDSTVLDPAEELIAAEAPVDHFQPPQKPDLSGLELLSNSIVEFESCRNLNKTESEENAPVSCNEQPADDGFGGLDLLCALAEQRFLEENEKPKPEKAKKEHRRKDKRKMKKHSSDEPKQKKIKTEKHQDEQRGRKKRKGKYSSSDSSDREKVVETHSCSCQTDRYKTYKSVKSEEDAKKFIASKTQKTCCESEWPCMNAMELDMRIKLAELQREYREKQKELNKLKKRKHSLDCSKKRIKRKPSHSSHTKRSATPPPLLDKMDTPVKPNKEDLTAPPVLSAMPKIKDTYKQSQSSQSDSDFSPEKHSSSKKRKVGRPKKVSSSSKVVATETIVAKKPKNTFVGYLLAAKEKLKLQKSNYPNATPPRFVEENYPSVKTKKTKNNNHIIADKVKPSKIRPKLKAEPTIKTYNDDDDDLIDMPSNYHWEDTDEELEDVTKEDVLEEDAEIEMPSTSIQHNDESFASNEEEEENDDEEEEEEEEDVDDEENDDEEEGDDDEEENDDEDEEEEDSKANDSDDHEEDNVEVKQEDSRCTLTAELLEVDKLRVLTAMGGLFYAGHLNAVEPPDVYSITLDGERGNRPHIMSREEILRDAIVEIAPKTPDDLPFGTRICAYWSQQYRCLYPGSVADPGTPDPQLDAKFVCVEFDDGDSGRIALDDIRLLPSNYPIIEYDPNPLLSLCKRRRRPSTSASAEEKASKSSHITVTIPQTTSEKGKKSKKSAGNHKEKKRSKKKKRDKLKVKLSHDDKKKRKKHRCSDENCKHKKHKKHRKHKKHHGKKKGSKKESKKIIVLDEIKEQDEDEEEFHAQENQESHETHETQQEEPQFAERNDCEEMDDNDDATRDDTEEQIEEDESEDDNEAEATCSGITMEGIVKATKWKKSKKIRDRQESCESRSKMSAFLPARQLWNWAGRGYKRQRAKGRSKKSFYKSIQRGKETITVGDSAVFLSTGRPDRPYIGRIEAMWELCGTMVVKVKWFYHPEETIGCPQNLKYPGALFESPHIDENDVQTIAHKCEVLPLDEYKERLGDEPGCYATIYDDNDIYYLAGYYDPTMHSIKIEPGIPFSKTKSSN